MKKYKITFFSLRDNTKMKIPIYHNKLKCWKCYKEIEIYYPEELAYKLNLGNVQKVYSKTMESETIGNICNHCGYYQGNWFIRNHFMDVIYENDFLESLLWIEADVKCEECGELIDYDIDEDESTIWDFFNGYYGNLCKSCINYENTESLIEELNNSSLCSVCKKIILNTDFEDFHGYILNDDNIVLSLPHYHHISYANDETIVVCSHCHAKIHNLNDPKYAKYKPIDTRKDIPDKRKFKLVPCGNNCGKRAKVKISDFKEDKKYYCSKCKSDNTDDKLSLEDWLEKMARE